MAEDIQSEERGGSIIQAILATNFLGGELKAAFRQGANELGAALKAFPDSIQIDEPGQVFNPLFRDRDGDTPAHAGATAQEAMVTPLLSPAEIAEASRGSVHGESQAPQQNVPSPSEIAQQSQGSVYGEPQAGQENTQSHEQGHGR